MLTICALYLTDFSLEYINISYTLKRQDNGNGPFTKSSDIIKLAAIWRAGWSQTYSSGGLSTFISGVE